jgi:hypothetical protein
VREPWHNQNASIALDSVTAISYHVEVDDVRDRNRSLTGYMVQAQRLVLP